MKTEIITTPKKEKKVEYAEIIPYTDYMCYYKDKLYFCKENLQCFPEFVTLTPIKEGV